MGRTVAPFSIVLAEEEARWNKLRRALRAEDRKHLDALFERARLNIQAAVQAASPDPMESMFLLMMMELEKEIHTLRVKVRELEANTNLFDSPLNEDDKN